MWFNATKYKLLKKKQKKQNNVHVKALKSVFILIQAVNVFVSQ